MKPFDLERAIAGDPVQLEDGRPAHYRFSILRRERCQPAHVFEVENKFANFAYVFNNEGQHLSSDGAKDEGKLVMPPVKKTVWVNFYGTPFGVRTGSITHDTQADAIRGCSDSYDSCPYIGSFPIEFEF